MGTYYIPRNYKGETRILYIFSIKSLITTVLGILIGLPFYYLFNSMGLQKAGFAFVAFFGGIGYVIGAVKIPTIATIPLTKKIGGESISEIVIRYIKFKRKHTIYTYYQKTKEEK